jgi:hypothetical protein
MSSIRSAVFVYGCGSLSGGYEDLHLLGYKVIQSTESKPVSCRQTNMLEEHIKLTERKKSHSCNNYIAGTLGKSF